MTLPSRGSYDAVVVGAGPAGVMAAISASRSGDVLLCDRSALPRGKSCGGMLHAQSRLHLARFGPLPPEMVLDPSSVRFRYHDWDRGVFKPTSLEFMNVDRARFDSWLLDLLPSDVEVRESCALRELEQDADGVTVTLGSAEGEARVRCKCLIGADGARSQTRRALGKGTVSTYVTLQDHVELDGALEPWFDCVHMRDIGDAFAYGYVIPKGETAIVGSVFYPGTKRPHVHHDEAIEAMRGALPQLGARHEREASAALCVRSANDMVPGMGRVLLAGEAGGFMSPTSGEGISYALATGLLAGEAVANRPGGEGLRSYEQSVEGIIADIRRRLRFLPVMESSLGKWAARYVPTPVVSRMTHRL